MVTHQFEMGQFFYFLEDFIFLLLLHHVATILFFVRKVLKLELAPD